MAPAGWTAQTNDPAPQRRDGAAATPPRAKNRAALAPNPSAPYLASGSTDVRSAALRTSLEEVTQTALGHQSHQLCSHFGEPWTLGNSGP